MAASLGSLVVSLGLNAAEFTGGLTRAEYQAKKFSDNLNSSLATAGKVAGVGLGLVAAAALVATKEIIASAAALDDFADQTGSSVEALSKLSNQAAISGVEFATLQGLVLKLSAGMAGADDESSNVGRALKALGITARDPAVALQEVAKALAGYADGVGKAAIARDLFGKGGPAFLANLKDIAQFGDVAATVTAKQAEEAEKLEQSLRRLSVESTILKNAVLSDLVPAINNLIGNFIAARQAGEGMFASLIRAGTNLDTLPDQISRARAEVENIQKAVAAGANNPLRILPGLVADQKDLDAATAKLNALNAIWHRSILGGQGDNSDQISRRFMTKPKLDYTGAKDKTGGGKTAKDAISEAQRYLENLQKQLQATENLTVAETVLADIRAGRLTLSGGITQEQLLGVAKQIDDAHAYAKALQEQTKAIEEYDRAREAAAKSAQSEAQTMAQQNQALRDETELIGKNAEQIAVIHQLRLDDAIATKEQALAKLQNVFGSEEEAKAIREQIGLLQSRKGLLADQNVAQKMADDAALAAAKMKEVNDVFANSFADSVTSVATGTRSISDAFKDMEKQIVASLSRIAAQRIAESLFGGGSGGGGDWITKLAGMAVGAFAGGGGGMTSTGGGFGEHFASGGVSRGGMAMVGERGRELVNLPRGAQVIPNHVLEGMRGKRTTLNQTINVLPGASTKTATQAAAVAALEVRRSSRNL
jgi:hypothetical protein